MDWKKFWQEVKRNSFIWNVFVPESEWNQSSPRGRIISLIIAILLCIGIFTLMELF